MKYLMILVISLGLVACSDSSDDSDGDTYSCENIAYKYTLAELQNDVDELLADNPTADLNIIDTSKITDMTKVFKNRYTFNGNVSCWKINLDSSSQVKNA